jgi:hypothetical protein
MVATRGRGQGHVSPPGSGVSDMGHRAIASRRGPWPVPLEGPPSLPSSCIYTTEDEFFTPESREWAARNVFGIEPIKMEGGHFPMLARHSELADVLVANLEQSLIA